MNHRFRDWLEKLREPRLRWLRVPIGFALVLAGIVGFLPILGFWMIPLGLSLLALDFPVAGESQSLDHGESPCGHRLGPAARPPAAAHVRMTDAGLGGGCKGATAGAPPQLPSSANHRKSQWTTSAPPI